MSPGFEPPQAHLNATYMRYIYGNLTVANMLLKKDSLLVASGGQWLHNIID